MVYFNCWENYMFKKFFLIFVLFFMFTQLAYSNENEIQNEDNFNIYQVVYNPYAQSWRADSTASENEILLNKKTIEGVEIGRAHV